MSSSLSSLERLPLDIWERIAFYTLTSADTFLGPPSGLCALALVSRNIYNKLSLKNNSHLYARIFRFKFDTSAPERRLTERWLTTRCLAAELIKRFSALRRIRVREFNAEDLWTCYLLLSESDGKNESQLFEYAGLKPYLHYVTLYRLFSSPLPWHRDTTDDSLICWLLWMTASRVDDATEEQEIRAAISRYLHRFVAAAYQYPSAYGPDSYSSLPICEHVDALPSHGSTLPSATEITYYSHKISVVPPLVTNAAILATTVRSEASQNAQTFYRLPNTLPPDRAAANALGFTGPTLQDFTEFHYNNRIRLMERCPLVVNPDFDQEIYEDEPNPVTTTGSARYEQDWSRIVGCTDPWIGSVPLKGVVFKIGSLCGSWAGRFMQPNFDAHMGRLLNPELPPTSVVLRHQPLYWTLHEHHCLLPDEPLLAGLDDMDGDNILNAWLPNDITIRRLEDAIEVTDPSTQRTTRYETFLPRSSAPYAKSACDQLEKVERPWISDESNEEIAEEVSELELGSENQEINVSSSYIDDDDEYADTVCHLSSGIVDILVTGETSERYGDAWGHFTIIGRVRPWDGHIVLLRTPRYPNQAHLGKWVFKGYIHDRNFVGRWRETSTPVGMIGFEGGFVVYKTEAA